MIISSQKDLDIVREGGKRLARIRDALIKSVIVGKTTTEIKLILQDFHIIIQIIFQSFLIRFLIQSWKLFFDAAIRYYEKFFFFLFLNFSFMCIVSLKHGVQVFLQLC